MKFYDAIENAIPTNHMVSSLLWLAECDADINEETELDIDLAGCIVYGKRTFDLYECSLYFPDLDFEYRFWLDTYGDPYQKTIGHEYRPTTIEDIAEGHY